jgi:hypothetical protein
MLRRLYLPLSQFPYSLERPHRHVANAASEKAELWQIYVHCPTDRFMVESRVVQPS